jgi:hypothetical protein
MNLLRLLQAIIDEQLLAAVSEHLASIVERYIPEADREGFVFHAMDIFSGRKYFSNANGWDLGTRIGLLKDLLAVPKFFELPVVLGYCSYVGTNIPVWKHIFAYFSAMSQVENYMLKFTLDNDQATLVAEDCPSRRRFIRNTHDSFLGNQAEELRAHGMVAMTRINGTVSFANKAQQALLQIADAIAFSMRRYLSDLSHSRELVEEMVGSADLINPNIKNGQLLFLMTAEGAIRNRPIRPENSYNAFLPTTE